MQIETTTTMNINNSTFFFDDSCDSCDSCDASVFFDDSCDPCDPFFFDDSCDSSFFTDSEPAFTDSVFTVSVFTDSVLEQYAHIDALLEKQSLLETVPVSNDPVDYVDFGIDGRYQYYPCNDDYDFYFLYHCTMPYFWTDMRYETIVFHDCVRI